MRRLALPLAVAAALAAAAALAWLWWTATPAAGERELAAALAAAPAADGRAAIAQPRRAARWAMRHPQSLALLALAAPAARAAVPRLEPLLRPLAAAARGPLVVWWRGRELAVAARVPAGAARAVALLAARAGVATRTDGDLVAVASDPALLAAPAAPPPAAGEAGAAALVETAGRLWRVTAGRSALAAAAGAPPALPEAGELSRVDALDAGPLLAALGAAGASGAGPARLALAAGRGWAAAIPLAALPALLREGLARSAGGRREGGGDRLWKGLLGEVVLRTDAERVILATSADLLAEVAAPPADDRGSVAGADAAWLAADLAAALARVPLLSREAAALRSAGELAGGLRHARWAGGPGGAAVELVW